MSDSQTIAALSLRDCCEDREKAFWQLWEQYQNYLARCCLKWMGNPTDAEDALSQAMLKAWKKIRNCTVEIKNIKSWLTQLTHNLCMDIHRECHRGVRQVESLEFHEELVSKEETPVLAA
ncbi:MULTISPECIES: RNA polymerase sigma factor [unclassified Nostoc]|uniref:RNA polymerase sigma factor n=1 Tax=unclassified Nostoc TaxID=2593658 RepID=UPI002AD27828|nr:MULTISPECIES: RNA polymerase sigma factor [unclassified Nostoc]MDZ8125925.1 RNA polymerase sigma factor [Nostoc sp. CmiVER01]MDZ8225792.1 RNA polymerase sigma factor [Nostoc sp. ChiVER01]